MNHRLIIRTPGRPGPGIAAISPFDRTQSGQSVIGRGGGPGLGWGRGGVRGTGTIEDLFEN